MPTPLGQAALSPFASVSQQASRNLASGTSTPAEIPETEENVFGDAQRLVALPSVDRTGSDERFWRPHEVNAPRRSLGGMPLRHPAGSEQEARLRDAVSVLEHDIANRLRSRQGSLTTQATPPSELPDVLDVDTSSPSRPNLVPLARSAQRRSLEPFLALDVRRSRPNSQPTSGMATPCNGGKSGESTATNSIAALSATTQDMVDLMTIRTANLRHRESMRRALPNVQEQEEALTSNGQAIIDAAVSTIPDRQAFGLGAGWSIITPEGPPAQAVQRALAFYSEETENRQSFVPVLKIIPTVLGKVSVALGADVLTLGLSNREQSLVAGGAVAIAVGIGVVVFAMWFLLLDMRRINRRRVPLTAASTLVGMTITTIGLVVGEMDIGAKSLAVRSVGAVIIGIGLTLLNTALPLSFAYSELVHGDTFRNYRNEAAFLLQGVGLGMATGLTLSRGAPRDNIKPAPFPFGVAHAFAVLGIAMNTMGTCLTATNLQRTQGRFVALRTRLRQHAQEARHQRALPPQTI